MPGGSDTRATKTQLQKYGVPDDCCGSPEPEVDRCTGNPMSFMFFPAPGRRVSKRGRGGSIAGPILPLVQMTVPPAGTSGGGAGKTGTTQLRMGFIKSLILNSIG